ncbi:hypothetical protein [Mycolicibacterium fluoranthenivorans]|uniref:Uncharacterized protein n=1 Tax=Mycolicibacterium fluoranthenivorans TaxID=258505 RepID=A0A1G4X138_9MYCO|nr:hypothetical protein [Mycolicibacterium fluoranthenivorans]SCX32923.1 hypothetical protein SAMN02799620_05744 [Mycolicibacterium fluoranthenivorans]
MNGNLVNIAAGAQTQSLHPYQAGYVPPDQGDAAGPSVPLRRGSWTTDSGDPATDADGFIRSAELAFRQRLSELDPASYSARGLQDRIAAFADGPEMRLMDAAQQAVEDAADAADAKVDDVRNGLSSNGDTAAELRATRYWNRTARLLDSVTDTGSLAARAQALVTAAAPEELGTLTQELGPYLESRGAQSDWVEAQLAQAAPQLGEALAAQSLAHKAQAVTANNANKLRNEVARTETPNGYGSGQPNALRDGLRFVLLSGIR